MLADLRKLIDHDLFEIPPVEHLQTLRGESDRASIILLAGMIESYLVARLRDKMPTLNSDETTRVFGFNGPIGTFSGRIWVAQALGIINRQIRRQLDIIREMRNVAAHAHPNVTFTTPQIKAATVQLFRPDVRPAFEFFEDSAIRKAFEVMCGHIVMTLTGQPSDDPNEMTLEIVRREAARLRASPERPQKPPPPSRSPKGRKGRQP